MELTTLLDDLTFPEGPRWRDGRLWFSDMHDFRVIALDLDGNAETVVEVRNRPSGLGWTPAGELLVVSMVDRKVMLWNGSDLREHSDLSELAGFHCNDMIVDTSGRAYVGNFGWDHEVDPTPVGANLIRVDPDGAASVAADNLLFPNGTVITPDGKTLIVGETYGGCLTAFDLGEDGALSNRRTWARMEGAIPDGICLDAEGAIWVASPISGEVLRLREGGEVAARIPVEHQAYACMLGGPEGRHLFICTAGSSDHDQCRAQRSGRIEVAEVDAPRAGLP